MSEQTFSGSCLCGSVHYTITAKVLRFFHCHCQRCRKATGTGHASNIIVRPSRVNWTAGESLLTYYKLPEAERFATNFCSHCGSPMPRVAPDMSIGVIPAGTLDEDQALNRKLVSSTAHGLNGRALPMTCQRTTSAA